MAILSSVLILYKDEKDRIQLLNEAYRILKPDGILVLNLWNDTFMIRNSIRVSRFIGKLKKDDLPKDFMGVHFLGKDVSHMVKYTGFEIEERIKTGQLMGLLESLQYITRRKYHRNFGNEQISGLRSPQNIKKDLFSTVSMEKYKFLKGFYWFLFKINKDMFSWMNMYILRKK